MGPKGVYQSPRWPSWIQDGANMAKDAATWVQRELNMAQEGAKMAPKPLKLYKKSIPKCIFFKVFGSILERILEPKSIQAGMLICELFFDGCWMFFYCFLHQHNIIEIANIVNSLRFFELFQFFL